MINGAIETILDISADSYRNMLYQLPDKQKELLLAIAREGVEKDVSSGAFVQRIGFQSSSSVISALKGLSSPPSALPCIPKDYGNNLELMAARTL